MEKINFSRTTDYMSSEGNIRRCKGIEIFITDKDTLIVKPLNERGGVGNAFIGIPRENIEDIMRILDRLKLTK